MKIGDRVMVEYEGTGTVVAITRDGIDVRIDSDGVVVSAAIAQVKKI